MGNKHVKRHSTAVPRNQVPEEPKRRYHHTPVRMAKLENPAIPNLGEREEQLEVSYTAGGVK